MRRPVVRLLALAALLLVLPVLRAAADPLPAAAAASLSDGVPVRVVTFNVLVQNRDYDRFSAYLRERRPDVVLLQEAGPTWVEKTALADFPYRAIGGNRIVVASRFPILDGERKVGRRSVRVGLDLGLPEPLIVYGLHPTSPRQDDGIARQARDYAAIGGALAAEPPEATVIAAGDFNATPAADVFHDLLAASGMSVLAGATIGTPTRFARELGMPTWVGVAIDHVIGRGRITFKNRIVGPDLGSDHLPVMVDLVVR